MMWTHPTDGRLESWTRYRDETSRAAQELREDAKTAKTQDRTKFLLGQAQLAEWESKQAEKAVQTIKATPEGEIPMV